jgi:hypothetical protein
VEQLLTKAAIILTILGSNSSLMTGRLDFLSKFIVTYFRLARRHPWNAVNDVVNLGLAGVSQLICFVLLLYVTGVNVGQLIAFEPVLILYGVLLGLGEMALSSFGSHIALRIIMKLFPSHGPTEINSWLTLARGGWMRYYLSTVKISPLPLVCFLTLTYVLVEELIFRGIVITYFLSLGSGLALAVSIIFFVGAQVLHTPNWRTAMFPVIGALIVGTIHGLLFLAVPNVLPLVIAHFVFFIVAVI